MSSYYILQSQHLIRCAGHFSWTSTIIGCSRTTGKMLFSFIVTCFFLPLWYLNWSVSVVSWMFQGMTDFSTLCLLQGETLTTCIIFLLSVYSKFIAPCISQLYYHNCLTCPLCWSTIPHKPCYVSTNLSEFTQFTI